MCRCNHSVIAILPKQPSEHCTISCCLRTLTYKRYFHFRQSLTPGKNTFADILHTSRNYNLLDACMCKSICPYRFQGVGQIKSRYTRCVFESPFFNFRNSVKRHILKLRHIGKCSIWYSHCVKHLDVGKRKRNICRVSLINFVTIQIRLQYFFSIIRAFLTEPIRQQAFFLRCCS